MVRQGSFNDTPARPRRSPGGKVGMALMLQEVKGSAVMCLCVWSMLYSTVVGQKITVWTLTVELIVFKG